jgi:hypothetical protein
MSVVRSLKFWNSLNPVDVDELQSNERSNVDEIQVFEANRNITAKLRKRRKFDPTLLTVHGNAVGPESLSAAIADMNSYAEHSALSNALHLRHPPDSSIRLRPERCCVKPPESAHERDKDRIGTFDENLCGPQAGGSNPMCDQQYSYPSTLAIDFPKYSRDRPKFKVIQTEESELFSVRMQSISRYDLDGKNHMSGPTQGAFADGDPVIGRNYVETFGFSAAVESLEYELVGIADENAGPFARKPLDCDQANITRGHFGQNGALHHEYSLPKSETREADLRSNVQCIPIDMMTATDMPLIRLEARRAIEDGSSTVWETGCPKYSGAPIPTGPLVPKSEVASDPRDQYTVCRRDSSATESKVLHFLHGMKSPSVYEPDAIGHTTSETCELTPRHHAFPPQLVKVGEASKTQQTLNNFPPTVEEKQLHAGNIAAPASPRGNAHIFGNLETTSGPDSSAPADQMNSSRLLLPPIPRSNPISVTYRNLELSLEQNMFLVPSDAKQAMSVGTQTELDDSQPTTAALMEPPNVSERAGAQDAADAI